MINMIIEKLCNCECKNRNNPLEQYTDKDIKNFTSEQIEIAYEHAIGYMEKINEGMRIINTRATVLLSYLVGAIAIFLSKSLNEQLDIQVPENTFLLLALVEYTIIIFIVVIGVVKPSKSSVAYKEPQDILTEKILEYNIKKIPKIPATEREEHNTKTMKLAITNELQELIKNKLCRQRYKHSILNFCIFFALIPLFIFMVYLIINIFSNNFCARGIY